MPRYRAVMPESAPNQVNTAAAGDTPEGTVRAAGGRGTALGRGEGTEAGPTRQHVVAATTIDVTGATERSSSRSNSSSKVAKVVARKPPLETEELNSSATVDSERGIRRQKAEGKVVATEVWSVVG